MPRISTAFARPWTLRTPAVTRYLEKEFVDEFFKDGKLRIPSFKKLRENPDEQRGDPMEGRISMRITTPNSNHSVAAINGQEAYILCAGTVEQLAMAETFNTKHGIRITNSLAFADSISRHIPGFLGGIEGLCSYREDLGILKYDSNAISPPDSYPDPEKWSNDYERYVAHHAEENFFIKHLKFSHQGEYRFVWFASGQERDFIDVVCPQAIQFCQRLYIRGS